jgi:hypothetical protein
MCRNAAGALLAAFFRRWARCGNRGAFPGGAPNETRVMLLPIPTKVVATREYVRSMLDVTRLFSDADVQTCGHRRCASVRRDAFASRGAARPARGGDLCGSASRVAFRPRCLMRAHVLVLRHISATPSRRATPRPRFHTEEPGQCEPL